MPREALTGHFRGCVAFLLRDGRWTRIDTRTARPGSEPN
jgi:hypothetical protein